MQILINISSYFLRRVGIKTLSGKCAKCFVIVFKKA